MVQADYRRGESSPQAAGPAQALARALSLSLALSGRMKMDEDGGVLDAVVLKLNPTRTRCDTSGSLSLILSHAMQCGTVHYSQFSTVIHPAVQAVEGTHAAFPERMPAVGGVPTWPSGEEE